MCGNEADANGLTSARSSVSVGILMVWAGAAMGKVEFENANRGLASSKKEKGPDALKSAAFSGSEMPGRIAPGTAGICGDTLVEESVAGKRRSCSSVGSVKVGTEA